LVFTFREALLLAVFWLDGCANQEENDEDESYVTGRTGRGFDEEIVAPFDFHHG
jgi:hypothetical protein